MSHDHFEDNTFNLKIEWFEILFVLLFVLGVYQAGQMVFDAGIFISKHVHICIEIKDEERWGYKPYD